MKLSPIVKSNNNPARTRFCAGKTRLYTDFDGTYFPFLEDSIITKQQNTITQLNGMYVLFQDFQTIAKEKFSTVITTGRNIVEMQTCIFLIKRAGVDFSSVEGFVLQDGFKQISAKDIDCDKSCLSLSEIKKSMRVMPDKLNQPKEEVRKIINSKSDDLVIVAGNEFNDVNMLNPLNYIDLLGVEIKSGKSIEELLQDEKILSALKSLPLISIVAGEGENLKEILAMKELLDAKGIHKILTARDPGRDLLAAIKKGMLFYSDENNKYKYNLGYGLYKEILER